MAIVAATFFFLLPRIADYREVWDVVKTLSWEWLAVFAVVALCLSIVGVYGVVAGVVNHSMRELGIRIALGATPRQIQAMVVGQGLTLVAAGLAIGLAGALATTRLMRELLFGVAPADPLTFSAIVLVLGASALAAAYVPARRAARIDPVESLRAE